MSEGGAGEEEESNRSAGRLWPFGQAALGAQQIDAQRGAMVSGGGAGEGEERSTTAYLSCPFGMADAVAAGQRTEEPDAVEDEIGGELTSAVTKRSVQRGALSVITTQRTM